MNIPERYMLLPSHYTPMEGGTLLPWSHGPINLDVLTGRILEQKSHIIYGIKVHSLGYMDITKDAYSWRWDSYTGFTETNADLRDAIYSRMRLKYTTPQDPVAATADSDIDSTLAERGARYGTFVGHAAITQAIKDAMKQGKNWEFLDDDQKECLEMIAHKVGRILNGDANYHDSWHDIVGYTKLVADRLLGIIK